MQDFWELIKIKPSRKSPVEGDVFVIQPKKNTYFFGKVIKANVKSKNVFVNSMWLIYIYNNHVNSEVIPKEYDLTSSELLISPEIINKKGWTLGYFYTIGNTPVTTEEKLIDYGFEEFSLKRLSNDNEQPKKYVDIVGNELSCEPMYHSFWGLSSYAVVGELVQKKLSTQGDGSHESSF